MTTPKQTRPHSKTIRNRNRVRSINGPHGNKHASKPGKSVKRYGR